jgi:hypothetical protein
MSCPLGDKKGRSADSSDLTRLHRETADLAAYISYTELDDNKKLKEQISEDSNFSLTRGGLTLLANSTIGFTRNPVTGEIVYRPYSGQRTSSPPEPSPPTNLPIWLAGSSIASKLAYSFDGITWEPTANGTLFQDVFDVAWNGTMWLAVGTNQSFGNGEVAYSYDGITWVVAASADALILEQPANGVAWNGTRWVIGGSGRAGTNKLIYSDDGITWTASSNGNAIFDGAVLAVAGNGTGWVAGGTGTNVLAYSNDNGVTWIGSTGGNAIFNDVKTVAWNGTIWLAGGNPNAGVLARSANGISWTACVISILDSVNSVAWNGTFWIAGGQGETYSLAFSADTLSWAAIDAENIGFSSVSAVAWNATTSRWVAVGQGPTAIAFSADGFSWSPSSNGNDVLATLNTVAAK